MCKTCLCPRDREVLGRRRTYLYVHRFLGSMVSIDWNYFIPLFAAMAVFLIGMFAYNAKKKDNE